MNRSVRLCAAGIIIAAVTAGACRKREPETPAPPPATATAPATKPATPPPPPPPPATTPSRQPSEDELFESMTLDELNQKGFLTDVHFSYDSTELTEQARGTLQKNMEFLKRRPSTKILVEGHADSRGTNEYNLALGERRANAVREYLVSLGLTADRVTIVSKGEEQPFCSEETEGCWQQNRRGHFIFTAK